MEFMSKRVKLRISRFGDASLVKGEWPRGTVEGKHAVLGRRAGLGRSYRWHLFP